MRDSLREVIRLTSFAAIKGLKVIGTDKRTEISAVDDERELIINVTLNEAVPEFEGVFGIPNLKLLESLLNFDAFREGSIEITRFNRTNRDDDGEETIVEVPQSVTFKDTKGGMANFWFNHGKSLPVGSDAPKVPWSVEFEPTKKAIQEFTKLANIFATPECRLFGIKTVGGSLRLTFGTEGATTHHGEMVFEENVSGTVVGGHYWPSAKLISVLKAVTAIGGPITLSVMDKLMMVSTSTPVASYKFYLRAQKEQ